jgi:hypothetical protein
MCSIYGRYVAWSQAREDFLRSCEFVVALGSLDHSLKHGMGRLLPMAVPVNDLHCVIICGMKGVSLVSLLPFDNLRLRR